MRNKKPVTKKAKTAPVKKQTMPHYTNTPFVDALEAFEQWKAGKPLKHIARERDFTKGVTKTFVWLAGGKDAFKALRAAGAGGHAVFGGGGGRTKEVRALDDSKVPKITANAHWRIERIYEPIVVRIANIDGKKTEGRMQWRALKASVHISPKNNRYVECKPTEKADLLLRVPITTVQYSHAVKALRDAEARANKCRKCASPMEWRCRPYEPAQHLACSNWPLCHSTKFEPHAVPPKRKARLEAAITEETKNIEYNVLRLRKYATSSVAKKLKHDAALTERGIKARKAKVQARKTTKAVIAKKAKEVAVDKKRATKVYKPIAKKSTTRRAAR